MIYCDDLGYGDPSCFGNKQTTTTNIDRLAAEGTKFTNFYVAQAVCGASRTALLTGCYPNRVGIQGAPGPGSRVGISDKETLWSELCRTAGYRTAIVGKWHLGDNEQFLPLQHGFDQYFGLPYSNDMWPFHPESPKAFPALPLIEQNKIINANVTADDQKLLVKQYTERAVKFIADSKQQPFFLYVAYAMPHVPLFVSNDFAGKSKQGLYGDVLLEIDWSVGQILDTLKANGLDENTWVIFTSDNGPWLSYGNHAGSAGGLREGKGTAWEGGVRVPCLMRWPGKIPAGRVCDVPLMTIDLLPTWCEIANAKSPELKIDGRSAWPVIRNAPDAKAPQQAYYFYWGSELHAVRSGAWKLHFPHPFRSLTKPAGQDGKPAGYTQGKTDLALFNLEQDPAEKNDVSPTHPDVVKKLQALADEMRADLGDALQQKNGSGKREPGRVPMKANK